MKILAVLVLCVVFLSSIKLPQTLAGKYIYAGDIENGRKEAGPKEYTLQRNYAATHFTAFIIQKGYKTERYETGNYSLNMDTCTETQTWCSQPSNLLNIPVHYRYSFNNDTLVLRGILPNGTSVEEYWKREK